VLCTVTVPTNVLGLDVRRYEPVWHILMLKCTIFDLWWGSAQTLLGELTAVLHIPLLNKKFELRLTRRAKNIAVPIRKLSVYLQLFS